MNIRRAAAIPDGTLHRCDRLSSAWRSGRNWDSTFSASLGGARGTGTRISIPRWHYGRAEANFRTTTYNGGQNPGGPVAGQSRDRRRERTADGVLGCQKYLTQVTRERSSRELLLTDVQRGAIGAADGYHSHPDVYWRSTRGRGGAVCVFPPTSPEQAGGQGCTARLVPSNSPVGGTERGCEGRYKSKSRDGS